MRDAFRLAWHNYWGLVGISLAFLLSNLVLLAVNVVPVLGQATSIFVGSLASSLAILCALSVARRTPHPVSEIIGRLSIQRIVELAVVLVPLTVVDMALRSLAVLGFFQLFLHDGPQGLVLLTVAIAAYCAGTVFKGWLSIKLYFAPFYVAAVPRDAAIQPFARMRQSSRLSDGQTWAFVLRYALLLLAIIPLKIVPFFVGEVLFAGPVELAAVVVIYHRLIGRDIAGLQPRVVTEADLAAEQAPPL